MKIPFIKAHGAGNDFLFTFSRDLPGEIGVKQFPEVAKAICHRNTGVGADGWYLIDRLVAAGSHAAVRLWNSDGSKAELSGNGTRCACAILVDQGLAPEEVHVATGSGIKIATLQRRDEQGLWFEMEMGVPVVAAGNLHVEMGLSTGGRDVTIIDVGNPQCSLLVDDFDFDWKALGDEIENHRRFAPAKTNVSFFQKVGDRAIDVRFWERGAHHTLSSGTGSVGAAVTAMLRGLVESPVTVHTEFCPMTVRWDGPTEPVFLTGPARIIARGEFSLH
jgi:diaminopimelate epimerase